jgi:hypothetical protein
MLLEDLLIDGLSEFFEAERSLGLAGRQKLNRFIGSCFVFLFDENIEFDGGLSFKADPCLFFYF